MDEAFVTLATTDTYALGALVLGQSLRQVGTTRRLVVMITPTVLSPMRALLSGVFDLVKEVDLLDSSDTVNLDLLTRPDLGVTFTKFNCWRLTQFKKCVFLDADTMVIQNVDDLFDRDELSAAPDAGWPDCFNSGVFVFLPSEATYQALIVFAAQHGTFDGGDQGLLNLYFRDWSTADINKHLPFTYNVVSQAFYSYLPAFKQFKQNVKIVHFIGAVKPWHHKYNSLLGQVEVQEKAGHSAEFLALWWSLFMRHIRPTINPDIVGCPINIVHCASDAREGTSAPYLDERTHRSYPMSRPYVPPVLDRVFYERTTPDPSPESTVPEPVPRHHSLIENFYPESPMSNITSEEPPEKEVYLAKQFEATWGVEEKPCPAGGGDSFRLESQGGFEPRDSREIKVESEILGDANISESHNSTEADEKPDQDITEVNNNTIPGGLVGDMALISLEPPTSGGTEPGGPALLSSEERKQNWEKGHVDYLGQDSFKKIQETLDATIQSGFSEKPVVKEKMHVEEKEVDVTESVVKKQ